MKCPKCNQEGVEELSNEVDIGVGVQKFVYGYECPTCGQIGVCGECGALDFQLHSRWCSVLKHEGDSKNR
jgi:hypothetical protein